MKILAINGSHRKGKNTAAMLSTVLAEAEAAGAKTELVELMDYTILECVSCNKCFFKPECSIKDDDMAMLLDKMVEADGIVFGSPVYFSNVTGRLKDFIDRSRPLHLVKNALDGKAGGAVVNAGLRNGGQELALAVLHTYMLGQGMVIAADRGAEDAIVNTGAMGTLYAAHADGRMKYFKTVTEDEVALASCRSLGRNMVALLKRMGVE